MLLRYLNKSLLFTKNNNYSSLLTIIKHFSEINKFNNNEQNDEVEKSYPTTVDSFKTQIEKKKLQELLNESSSTEIQESPSGEWYTQVYPKGRRRVQDQSLNSVKPKVDPKDTTIILFPGQGAQFVGMGRQVIDVPHVPEMFNIAKKILGYDLLHLCLNGPIEHLNKTQYCQPAMFVTSLAAVERLRLLSPGQTESCVGVAGFSVGELAALVFAGAFSFEDGLRLVKIRAEAMQYTSDLVPSGMMTVFLTPAAKVNFACKAAKEWCIRKGIEEDIAVCTVANYLFPHCKVIAGHDEALSFLRMNAQDFGIKKFKVLPVSGAFHTKLMKPAKDIFRNALKNVKIEMPLIPVYSNYDGKIYTSVESIKNKLCYQITSPVKWEQTMHSMYERKKETPCPKTYECGPGITLLGLLSKNHGIARRNSVHVPV